MYSKKKYFQCQVPMVHKRIINSYLSYIVLFVKLDFVFYLNFQIYLKELRFLLIICQIVIKSRNTVEAKTCKNQTLV